MSNQFSPFKSINGDTVVAFTSSKEIKNLGWLDASRVSSALLDGENSHRKHLGLINLFATSHKRPMKVMRNLLKSQAVLNVNPLESVTYDLPVHREATKATVTEDTSTTAEYFGIGEAQFPIVLSREFSASSTITYDELYGQQAIVMDVEPVGDSFRHWVKIMSFDKETGWDPSKLKPGTEYFRVTTVAGEFDERFANIDLQANPVGTITNEFVLGDPRALETFYTAKAASANANGLTRVANETRTQAMSELEKLANGKDMYFITSTVKDAQGNVTGMRMDKNIAKVGPALEYFVLAELALLEAKALAYAKGGVISTNYGIKRLNEGLWHQYRRSKIINYSRPGGLTLDHIQQAAAYVFKNSEMPVESRVLRMKAGSMAYNNVMQIFREEVKHQLAYIDPTLFGTESKVTGKLFTGSLDALEMNVLKFKSVAIPGIGTIEVELDETLDYQGMTDKISAGFHGNKGVSRTSYSLLIEDANAALASNVNKRTTGTELVEGGMSNAPTYYIKPEGSHVVFGYEQGRMANEGGQTSWVQSSLKTMGRSFWAHSTSAALALDVTNQIWIELDQ